MNTQPVILLTGFEPFGGSAFNTSWDVVSAFDDVEIRGYRIRTLKLKVIYDGIHGPLEHAVETLHPVAVIAVGEGTPQIHIERIARNSYHAAKPRDNAGNPPPRAAIVPGGAEEIPSGLPVDAIVNALKAADIPVAASTDAGGFLCNECFYRLMALKAAPVARGFLHVPVVPPSDAVHRKQLHAALLLIVNTTIEALKK